MDSLAAINPDYGKVSSQEGSMLVNNLFNCYGIQ